ncbi:hypothetical protein BX265_2142 [Streptomyces sp. TLI_235]|nr:hypothetical protein BX265_2142 [Streptomyces sp. TLI_235]
MRPADLDAGTGRPDPEAVREGVGGHGDRARRAAPSGAERQPVAAVGEGLGGRLPGERGGVRAEGGAVAGGGPAVRAERAVPAVAAAPIPHRPARGEARHRGNLAFDQAGVAGGAGARRAPLADQHRQPPGPRVGGDRLGVPLDEAAGRVPVPAGLHGGVVEVRRVPDPGRPAARVGELRQPGGRALADQHRRLHEQPGPVVDPADGADQPPVHVREPALFECGRGGGQHRRVGRVAVDRPERLVEQVVAQQGRVAAQFAGDGGVQVGLGAAQVGVVVEVPEGGLHGGLEVAGEPVVGVGLEGQPVVPGRPDRDAAVAAAESGPVHVLVEVDDGEQAVPGGGVQQAVDAGEFGVVVAAGGRFQPGPGDGDPHQGEAPCGDVAQVRLAALGVLVEVEAAQLQDAAVPVGEERPAVRGDRGAGRCAGCVLGGGRGRCGAEQDGGGQEQCRGGTEDAHRPPRTGSR